MRSRLGWAVGVALGAALVCGLVPQTPARGLESDQIWIASGWFRMGSRQAEVDYGRRLCVQERLPSALRLRGCSDEALFSNEQGERRVLVSAYGLDRYEVTRAQYLECVAAGACTPTHLTTQHPGVLGARLPVTSITWRQAQDVCAFRGGRLPTEAEWERAARGDSRRRFPWGRYYNERLANHGGPEMALDPLIGRPDGQDGFRFAAPVGSFADGRSAHGALDMAGNVWEWTADGYAALSEITERIDPTGAGDTGLRVVRGGSWRSPAFTLRVTYRGMRPEGGQWVDVGVRCAYDAGAEAVVVGPEPL